MNLPEILLWQVLRKSPAGLRFRRQHPAGRYVLDFFCQLRTLAIEVDGMVHDLHDQSQHDIARDEWLTTQGVAVMRVPARDVLRDLDEVAGRIVAKALERPQVGSSG